MRGEEIAMTVPVERLPLQPTPDREPRLMPTDEGRSSGYVPNVVYSCGAMIHGRKLILPYAISDLTTSVVRIDVDELLASLHRK
jgi:predicted GH43/DUF377 family glycosyl hydrolase